MLTGNGDINDRIYTAISAEQLLPYMANFSCDGQDDTGSERSNGRKPAVDDGRLWGQRDALVFLIGTTWPDIGGRLPRIKTAAEVYDLVKVWEVQNLHNSCYVAQVLLRPAAIPATASTLNEKRRRGGELHSAYLEAESLRNQCGDSLATAQRAYSPDLSEEDRAAVEEQIAKRTERLANAERDLAIAQERDREMQALIEQGEAYFARAEFARFCKSKRYRLTPLNLANALAGLPYIGWRQSLQRCQARECPGVNGGAMQEFDAIRSILRSGPRKSQLVKHAQQWLGSKGKTKSHAAAELQQNWYYLRKAIQSALDARTRTRDLPFVITRDYRDRVARATNVDRLFAEEEAL